MNTTEAPALVKHNEACWVVVVVAVFADVVVVIKVAPSPRGTQCRFLLHLLKMSNCLKFELNNRERRSLAKTRRKTRKEDAGL